MKLLQKIRFALKYDIDSDFIVYSIPDQIAMQFSSYDEAKKFSDNQPLYKPKVMISIRIAK